MSIWGGPYARFQRALATNNPPPRGDRAAVRWLGRLALEVPALTLAELHVAAGALAALAHGRTEVGREALAAVADAHGLGSIAGVLAS